MGYQKHAPILIGDFFGKLTVEKELPPRWIAGQKYAMWFCSCACSGAVEVQARLLKSGQVQSCGCSRGRPRDQTGQLINRRTKPTKARLKRPNPLLEEPRDASILPIRPNGEWFWRGRWRQGDPVEE